MEKAIGVVEWIEGQSGEIGLGIAIPMLVLRAWYGKAGQDPDEMLHLIAMVLELDDEKIVLASTMYLHMSYGDRKDFPPEVRKFLKDSRLIVVPVLSEMLAGKFELELPSGGVIDSHAINTVVHALPAADLLDSATRENIRRRAGQLLMRAKFTTISMEAENLARQYVDSGEVPVGHPAHGFLAHIVEVAPSTRQLPAKAAELLALVTG